MVTEGSPRMLCEVETPSLVLDVDKMTGNIQRMSGLWQSLGVILRPHMKTHKAKEIGRLMTNNKKRCIVVSTLKEAEVFAEDGFDDIMIGFIFTADKLPRLRRLAKRLTTLHVMVDSDYCVQALLDSPPDTGQWSVVVKVDCGGNRSGCLWNSDEAVALCKRIHSSPSLRLYGLYAHDGNTYYAKGVKKIQSVASTTTERILQLKHRLMGESIPIESSSIGSTPSCSRPSEDMAKLDEVHPGNYVFYDLQQYVIGSCDLENIALRVATRVKGHFPHRQQLLVDAGFTAFSHDGKDLIPGGGYCWADGHQHLRLVKLAQEVGYVESADGKIDFKSYPIGAMLFFYPYHACATATRHSFYHVHKGQQIIDQWTIQNGW